MLSSILWPQLTDIRAANSALVFSLVSQALTWSLSLVVKLLIRMTLDQNSRNERTIRKEIIYLSQLEVGAEKDSRGGEVC